jgi:hypothetical protein
MEPLLFGVRERHHIGGESAKGVYIGIKLCDGAYSLIPIVCGNRFAVSRMEEKMKISRRQIALIPCVLLLGAVYAGAALADATSFKVPLTGAQGVPPVDTTGSGTAELTYDPATRVVTWNIAYSGLSSAATMAHFHGPAEQGKNAPPTIWLSTQGSPPTNPIKGSATLTPDQAKQFSAGEWYVNVHSQSHPAGEIRGQVVPPKS